ncbi:3599_t:CDS:2 [Funneliformis geosporum]|nr:3599_t:CDS:2 [Funneliformis geosporum]
MLDQFSNIISWSNESQIDEISYGFESISSFNSFLKKVIGAVDDSHIHILPTIKNSERYINRKGYHSINLMGVVDYTKKFTYVYIVESASVHNARNDIITDLDGDDNYFNVYKLNDK